MLLLTWYAWESRNNAFCDTLWHVSLHLFPFLFIGDDAEENDPLAPNPFSSEAVVGEELHLDDPKKTLRGWYEREGYDEPEYIIEESGHGRYKCTVE